MAPIHQESETLISKGEIPIIDLVNVDVDLDRISKEIVEALSESRIKLAMLVNHGISDSKLQLAYKAFDEFRRLPEEIQDKYQYSLNIDHGYVKPGKERFSNNGEKEVRHAFNIRKIELIPEAEVPGFKEIAEELLQDLKQLTKTLLTALAIGIGQPPEFFVSKHANIQTPNNPTLLRILYYPPLASVEPNMIRCGAHCDFGTFTLLAQDSEGGLEIKPANEDKWLRVGYTPGAILLNTGEMLDRWTGGKLPALWHRVVVPENYGRGRNSIAFFVNPDNDAVIEPLVWGVTKEEQELHHCHHQAKNMEVMTAQQLHSRRLQEVYLSHN